MPAYNFIYQQTEKDFVCQPKVFQKGFAHRKTNATIARALNKDMLTKSHSEKRGNMKNPSRTRDLHEKLCYYGG